MIFDSSLEYEVCVLKAFSAHLFDELPAGMPRLAEARELQRALELFEVIDASNLPKARSFASL